jgi:hypothetical protein
MPGSSVSCREKSFLGWSLPLAKAKMINRHILTSIDLQKLFQDEKDMPKQSSPIK